MLFIIKGIFPLKTLVAGGKFSGRIFITYSTKLRTTDLIIMFLSHLIMEYDMTRHSAAMNHDNNTNKHYTLHITHYTTDWIIVWTNHQSFYLINLLSNDDQRLYFLIPQNLTNSCSSEDLLTCWLFSELFVQLDNWCHCAM